MTKRGFITSALSPANLTVIVLIIVFSTVYLTTLLPGVSRGDSAELQYSCPLLGICHAPGYQIEVTFGKLFSILPIGSNTAWRINFMMAVFGTIGALALYGAVRRITGFIIPGIVAATILGFSSIYWTHCLQAEAYVFYSSFLLLAIYTLVRFIDSDKAGWLYLTALFLGVCIADRSSELFVLPAFFILWLFVRKKVRLNLPRILLTVVIFILPFVYTVGFFLLRSGPTNPAGRDNELRNQIVSGDFSAAEKNASEKLQQAMRHCLGLTYTKDVGLKADKVYKTIDRYSWLLSGMGTFGYRYELGNSKNNGQARGTSVGILGILLILTAMVFWRRQYGWFVFGLAMFIGNFIFILWHSRWDNLTFTIPGQIGLCLLAGLGSAGIGNKEKQPKQLLLQTICLAAPIFLLITNYRFMDMSTNQQYTALKSSYTQAAMPLPKNSVILDTYWPTMTIRYIFYIQANRPDLQVLYAGPEHWPEIVRYFAERDQPVFVRVTHFSDRLGKSLAKKTPPQIAQLGWRLMNPQILSRKAEENE